MLFASGWQQSLAASASEAAAEEQSGAVVTKESMISVANAIVDSLSAKKFGDVVEHLEASVKPNLPPAALEQLWQALTTQCGAFKERRTARAEASGQYTVVIVPVVFGEKNFDVKVVFSGSTKVTGFFIEPEADSYKAPSYVRSSSFTEENVKVGSGMWQLDGVVSMPKGDGPFPGVVLVHGSGGHDKDETVGPNKPFRDLAQGLASNGVAVLRYEKRTKQHAKLFDLEMMRTFTIKDEVIDDAVEAVKALRDVPKIDKKAIVVLGHSLSGMVLPRIAAADKDIGGFIFMAALNESSEDAMVRQTEYISELDGGKNPELVKQIAIFKDQAAKIKALTPADMNSGVLILGAGPAYWLDLKAHDPLEEVKNIERPMLFLQGGRDYQVTTDGDLARWKTAVQAGGKDGACEFKVYPQLNHLFFSGTGKLAPAEYKKQGNVEPVVVSDIALWVKNLKK